jgi:hypothetical protein
LIAGWIVTPNHSVDLSSEVDFAISESNAVRPAQRAQVHPPEFLLAGEVDDRDGAARRLLAIDADKRELSIGLRLHLVWFLACVRFADDFPSRGIDDGQRCFFLVQDQQCGGRSLSRTQNSSHHKEQVAGQFACGAGWHPNLRRLQSWGRAMPCLLKGPQNLFPQPQVDNPPHILKK